MHVLDAFHSLEGQWVSEGKESSILAHFRTALQVPEAIGDRGLHL